MQLSDRARAQLERYAPHLPAREYAALEAWLTTFWPFQLDWLLEPAEQAISCKSRQIGLSHTTSAVGVLWGAFHGELTTIISIGQLESTEVLDKAKKHAAILAGLGSRMAVTTLDNATELAFASGGRILALPSSGGRSFSGNVFLDEYAYQERASKVWDAAAAVTMLDGRLRVASTPNGVGNEFHGLWSDPKKHEGWARHEIPMSRAIADGYPVDLAKCWTLAKNDPRLFDQLFNCQFLDGEEQYIPTDAVSACTAESTLQLEGQCYAGLDIGKRVDLTVLVIVRVVNGVRWVQHIETRKRTSADDVKALAALAFSREWRCRRLCVDSTGLGEFPAEEMQKRHGIHRVELVNFGKAGVKEDLATELYGAMTAKPPTLRIPRDEKLRTDICSIRRIITTAGNVRYDAPHTDAGHADRAWALSLALHASGRPLNRRHEVSPEADAEREAAAGVAPGSAPPATTFQLY